MEGAEEGEDGTRLRSARICGEVRGRSGGEAPRCAKFPTRLSGANLIGDKGEEGGEAEEAEEEEGKEAEEAEDAEEAEEAEEGA